MKTEFKKRILFVGIPDMAFVCLEACYQLGVNVVGVMGPKSSHNMYLPFKQFVESKGLNFIKYNTLDSEELINEIKSLDIDLAVVCSFNYKIPEKLLEATKDGFINLHPSLLPAYRGANPYSNVIINNETITGVTLHKMTKDFDKGDIILQHTCNVSKNETMGTLFNKTNDICVQLLLATLKEYEERPLPSIPQKEGNYPKANSIDEKNSFIDYNKTAEEIERFVRALNPFILASTLFRNNIIRVMNVEIINQSFPENIKNGTIVRIEDNKVLIKTKQNCIAITLMQYGSHFIGNEKDFIDYINPQIGERFY